MVGGSGRRGSGHGGWVRPEGFRSWWAGLARGVPVMVGGAGPRGSGHLPVGTGRLAQAALLSNRAEMQNSKHFNPLVTTR